MRAKIKRETIRQYLLGTLSLDEDLTIEERRQNDTAFDQRVGVVEATLIEEYLEGTFSKDEQEAFIENYLSCPDAELQEQRAFGIQLIQNFKRAARMRRKN